MKFKFPLQKVMEHRKILEGLAQKDFQEALAELNHEQEVLHKYLDQKSSAYDRAFEQQHAKSGRTSEELQNIHEFLEGLKTKIERQRAKIQDCENLVESLREILKQKAIDYKIIERLKERRKAEFIKEVQQAEQRELDEISILKRAHGERK